jgi:ferric-dicitrate binding protein FerR (iron transport regulator)
MTADDSRLRGLMALARKMSHAESARRDAASFERFEERLLARAEAKGSPKARLAFGGAVLAFCLGAVLWRGAGVPREEPALRYAVQASPAASASVADDGADDGQPGQVQRLSFSDGSHVVLAPHASADVAELSAHGARVRLARGHAEVSIARRKHAAWSFAAGPYTVHVTGTAFKLSWSEERQEVEVGMHHGSVIVSGPLAPGGVALRAGQRLVACDRTQRLVVEEWTPAPAPELAQLETKPRAQAQPAREQAHRGARARAAASAPAEYDWAKKVAQGDFDGVLREAKQLGHTRVLASAQVADLTALADAARYAGKTTLGRDALLALRARFPEADMARDSAFFLGRLSQGETALGWYDRYLREQPEGTYESQALGRSMMLRYEQGDGARAAELAGRYLARFPTGPYAASARKLRAPSAPDSARAPGRGDDARAPGRGNDARAPGRGNDARAPGRDDARVTPPAP